MRVLYHLRRIDGSMEFDTLGLDVAADKLAAEAVAGARALVCEAIENDWPLLYERIVVTDQNGVTLYELPFSAVLPKHSALSWVHYQKATARRSVR